MEEIARQIHTLHGPNLEVRLYEGFKEADDSEGHVPVKGTKLVRKIMMVPKGQMGDTALKLVKKALRQAGTGLQDHLEPADRSEGVFATFQDVIDPHGKKRPGTIDNDDYFSEHPTIPNGAMQLQVLLKSDPKTPNKKKIYKLFKQLMELGHKPHEFFFIGR